ncbi:MAG: hypothetical protein ACAH59_07155 [Pseudobdellovibrionaceae bacterium]
MTKHLMLGFILVSLMACANKEVQSEDSSSSQLSGSSTSAAPTASASAASPAGPTAACKAIAEAAKNKNFETFASLSTGMPPKKAQPKKADFEKMGQKYFEKIQDLSCNNEIIAEDHAVVEADAKGEKRLIPFLQTPQGWKFDMKTYQSFYHTKESHSQPK